MRFKFPTINFPFFTRNIKGDTFYDVTEFGNWCTLTGTNLEIAQNHPILTPAILFLSKLFSQADFFIEDKKTGEKIYDHWVLDLLKKPNYYQTGMDFLESHLFTQIAEGQAIVWIRRVTGVPKPEALYLLNPNLIEFPDEFRTGMPSRNETNKVKNTHIVYDKEGENQSIPIRDLLFFYDLPNCLNTENCFKVRSRMDGLKQTLINTKDSLLAKNIILKTNGKELITGDKSTGKFPLSDDEKIDVETLFHNNYGLGANRKRGIVTMASLKWQSLHIALRDLGLDESVKVDGNLIYTALHLPKDILSLEAKKTTYNNFKESMVSYIQNEMQPTLDAFLAVMQPLVTEKNLKLGGSYEHMPIMQFVLIERYEGIEQRGLALSALRNAGLPDELALEICGFEKGTKLSEIIKPQENGSGTNTTPAKRRREKENEEAIFSLNGHEETND